MGFSEKQAIFALKESENDFDTALDILINMPHFEIHQGDSEM